MSVSRPVFAVLASILLLPAAAFCQDDQADLRSQLDQLVRQLNAPQAAQRDDAEQAIIQLGEPGYDEAGAQAVLALLPEPNDRMPPEVRHRLMRIRQTIEKADAQSAVSATLVTLQASEMPLADVFAAIEKQTGNRIIDQRQRSGEEVPPLPVTIELEDRPFWAAMDEILDQTQLTTYNFSGENALVVKPRGPNAADRAGQASYAGPFRIAATQVHAIRDLSQTDGDALRVTIEIAWEPRLAPIRISHPFESLAAVSEDGDAVATAAMPTAEFEAQAIVGSQSAELQLQLSLPPRSVEKIARLSGRLNTVIPGRTETFRFEELEQAARVDQRRGGALVTLDRVRKSGQIWELYMRLQFDETSGALESHRGWVMKNVSYLVDADGARIEHVGLETTHQSEQEIGVAYLFELPQGKDNLEGLAWEYHSPAAIIQLPIEYELTDIRLP